MIVVSPDGKISRANQVFCQLLGYREEELQAMTVLDITHPDDRALTSSVIRAAARPPSRAISLDKRYVRKDGTTVWAHVSGSWVFGVDGEPFYSVALVQDLTERRELERRLHEAQKMEAIGALASGVAHEFNNILMGVRGCAEMALGALPPESPARAYLNLVGQAVDAGASITQQLLTFARRGDSARESQDLHAVITSYQGMLQRLLGDDICLAVDLRAVRSRVCCVPGHIEQILMNLAANARQAMACGGSLAISTCDVELREGEYWPENALSVGAYVQLTVADTGHGMTESLRSRAFEPFFTTKEGQRGAGLGLATVYGIVQQLGGHVEIRSREGSGTAFELLFPASSESRRARSVSQPLSKSGKRGTVLVVDDEPAIRRVARRFLEAAGYRVLQAGCAEQVFECGAPIDTGIDLLVTDVMLPDMAGPKLVEELRAAQPQLKVIFISGYPATWLAEHGYLQGDAVALQKPFAREELLDAISGVLAQPSSPR
jgi:PAS domain S-box-containing protein